MIVATFVAALVLVLLSVTLYLYWSFVCWVAEQTNIRDGCLLVMLLSLVAEAYFPGRTTLALVLLGLSGVDLGSLLGRPNAASVIQVKT